MEDVRRLTGIVALAMLGAGTSACARLHARTVGPPLEAPLPPPRVIVPIESQPFVASPLAEDIPARPPARARERPAAPRTEPAESPAAPPAYAPTAEAPEPRTLQTTADPVEAEQKTRAALANATHDLNRIDYRTLGADARAQYDIAKRFAEQAEDALRAKNPVFARQLAEKAATLAALLQER